MKQNSHAFKLKGKETFRNYKKIIINNFFYPILTITDF